MFAKSIVVFTTLVGTINAFGYADCDGYNTLESQVNCGPDHYLLKYGIQYCHKFFTPEYSDNFDAAGKVFLECAGQCLLNKTTAIVNQQVANNAINCDQIDTQAIDSHSDCYTQCKFCNICKKNKGAMLSVFDIADFGDPRIFNEALVSIASCGFKCLF